jgi:hypothetical protein
MTQADLPPHRPIPNIKPEYEMQPGETQQDALRCEIMILIDYALDVGMTDDDVDEVFRNVFDERAKIRRKEFKIVKDED